MPEHYVDKSDWRDGLYQFIYNALAIAVHILMVPIAIVMRLMLGERKE